MSKGIKYTTESFIKAVKLIHKDSFDYSKVIYINSHTNVEVICPIHGSRFMTPGNLLNGCKCKLCKSKETMLKRMINTEEFIIQSKIIYGADKFGYSKCIVNDGRNSKVVLICKVHGEFITDANSHLSGKSACPNCRKNKKKSYDQIINDFKQAHGDFYNYSKFIFKNTKTKGIIVCPLHGEFLQIPEVHKKGVGCPKCARESYISKKETKWLDDIIKLPNSSEYRQKEIIIDGKRFVVDGFYPKTQTIYEFYGDYWHGNPRVFNGCYFNKHLGQTMSYLYNKTIQRENLLINNGYTVINMWELDYGNLNELSNDNPFSIIKN